MEEQEMTIAIASDHGGFDLKQQISAYLFDELNYEVVDYGTFSKESCSYSEHGIKCAEAVASHKADFGIVICTTGEGIMIASNKVKGIRCGLAYNDLTAEYIRRHNDCNMLAMGAKFTTFEQAKRYIDIFLNTPFEGGRHALRVNYIKNYEENHKKETK